LYACYDSKVDDGRKPFFLKMRHGKVCVFQPGVVEKHRLSWIGLSAAAAPATEEGNRIEWFMASGTRTKRKSSSSASPTCVWMRRTRVDPASPSVLGLPHHLVSLRLVRLSGPQQTTTACAPLTATVATASTPSRSASALITPSATRGPASKRRSPPLTEASSRGASSTAGSSVGTTAAVTASVTPTAARVAAAATGCGPSPRGLYNPPAAMTKSCLCGKADCKVRTETLYLEQRENDGPPLTYVRLLAAGTVDDDGGPRWRCASPLSCGGGRCPRE